MNEILQYHTISFVGCKTYFRLKLDQIPWKNKTVDYILNFKEKIFLRNDDDAIGDSTARKYKRIVWSKSWHLLLII